MQLKFNAHVLYSAVVDANEVGGNVRMQVEEILSYSRLY